MSKPKLVDLVDKSLETVRTELGKRRIDLSNLMECSECSTLYVPGHKPLSVQQDEESGNYLVRRNGYELTLSTEQMLELCKDSGLCSSCLREYRKGSAV
jgi:hypothetical protein